jgi:hypothetical protein
MTIMPDLKRPLVMALCVLIALAGSLCAEPADQPVKNGAAALFINGFPSGAQSFCELALLAAGEEDRVWTLFDADVVRSIPPWMLGFVKDNVGMTQEIGDQEQDAYFTMLIFANRTSPAALDKAGKENREADWAHIFREPANYRGEIVHFEGTLKKLRKFTPQPMAAQGGVRNYYEGYMYADVLEDNPVFFEITELPKGLAPDDHLNVKVGLSGYYFKKFRYTAVDTKKTNKDRLAPLVIGRTLTLLTEPAAAEEEAPDGEWARWLGPSFFGVIGLTAALLFAIGYWYRRSDGQVRGRVSAVRHADFIAPPPPPEEPRTQ